MNDNTPDQASSGLTYRDAGVDIDAGNALVERIKPAVKRTMRPEVMGGLGGFGGLFDLGQHGMKHPVLVSGTDGVGTKLKLAQRMQRHDSIGVDLVAMCVNDVLVQGAEPLFFLDYFACGKLDVEQAANVVTGIAAGCELAGCALIGGETAEMPDMYPPGDYDLAGFSVGLVEKSKMLDGSQIRPGQTLVAVGSSGPHSNGYSLIRRIISLTDADLDSPLGDTTLGEALMAPTRIYVKPILDTLKTLRVTGLCHITGGGLSENLLRVLPEGVRLRIDLSSWKLPPVFRWLADNGGVEQREMLRTFNCGIGMAAILEDDDVQAFMARMGEEGWPAWVLGAVEASEQKEVHLEGLEA
jgi:phosphoribosylformylglycinamidine cyclo-ligase